MDLLETDVSQPSPSVETEGAVLVPSQPSSAKEFLIKFAAEQSLQGKDRLMLQNAIDLVRPDSLCLVTERDGYRDQVLYLLENHVRRTSPFSPQETEKQLVQLNKSLHELNEPFNLPPSERSR